VIVGINEYTIYDIICRNAQIYADQDCIVFNNNRLSHREFKNKCDQLAAGLVQSGVEKGDRLGILANNSSEFIILYGAAAKIGAIMLPVNWRFQQKEVEYILAECTPKLMFVGTDYRNRVIEISRKVKSIKDYYAIGGGELSDGLHPFEELYSKDGAEEKFDISVTSGFVIIHTAAVDARPRGALLSQANFVFENMVVMNQYGLGCKDCHLCFLPLFHIAGLVPSMAVMHAGGKNVIAERFDPELVLRLIEHEKVTIFFHFPPILKSITEKYGQHTYDLSSLQNIAGLDHPDNIQGFLKIAPGTRAWIGFGQTETLGVSDCTFDEKPGSVGRPHALTRLALFDDYDHEVPIGTPGEICVRSPTVFLGYWGREDDNAYTFRNGWHHTGDIGRVDEKGYLWYVKRKAQKELIKTGGENVYPAEVEKAILDHEAIAEVSVIGVPDPQWGEAIKAICVLKQGMSLDSQDLINFVALNIARYKKPKFVVFVDALPKTQEGDIDREKLKKNHGGIF
jgi:long-chain acyl-CoA synthetase